MTASWILGAVVLLRGKAGQLLRGRGAGAALVRGGAVSFGMSTFALALGFLTNVLVSRMLGVDGYGQFAIALGWCMILAIPAMAGMDFAVLRYAPVYFGYAGRRDLLGLAAFAMLVTVLASSVCIACVGVALHLAPNWVGGISAAYLTPIGITIAGTALLGVNGSFFRARYDVFYFQFYPQVLRGVLVVGVLGYALVRAAPLSLEYVFWVLALSIVACLFLQTIHLSRFLQTPEPAGACQSPRGESMQWRSWLTIGAASLVAAMMQQIMSQSGVVLLGVVSDAAQAALYAAASRLAVFVTFFLSAIAAIAAPMVVRAHEANDRHAMQRVATICARFALAGAIPVAGALILGGGFVLKMFGPGFANAFPALAILACAGVVSASTGICAILLIMTERSFLVSRIMTYTVVCQVALTLALGNLYGAVGAALASAVAVLISNGTMAWKVHLDLGVNPARVWALVECRPPQESSLP